MFMITSDTSSIFSVIKERLYSSYALLCSFMNMLLKTSLEDCMERGLVDLDDPIAQHIDRLLQQLNHTSLSMKCGRSIHKVLVKHLLHMISGLGDYDRFERPVATTMNMSIFRPNFPVLVPSSRDSPEKISLTLNYLAYYHQSHNFPQLLVDRADQYKSGRILRCFKG